MIEGQVKMSCCAGDIWLSHIVIKVGVAGKKTMMAVTKYQDILSG